MGFKFVHTADVHLDSPFSGAGEVRGEVAGRFLHATFKAFQNIIDLCIVEKVDFLLIAGDVYNEADLSLQAQLFCREEFKKLTREGIEVFIAHGNHDHCAGWRADLDWPHGVHFFPTGEVGSFSFQKAGREVARIFGVSYPARAVLTDYLPQFVEARKQQTSRSGQLAERSDQQQNAEGEPYSIGVLHTNAGGIAGYDNYAPCTLTELTTAGFDYWALGHVHTYLVLHEANPTVIYPGIPQGRHTLEEGPKGCCVVEVSELGKTATGQENAYKSYQGYKTTYRWVETADLRWQNLSVSIDTLTRVEDLLAKIGRQIDDAASELVTSPLRGGAAERGLIFCITLTGRGVLAKDLRRSGFLQDLLEGLRTERQGVEPFIWVATLKVTARPALDLEELREEESLFGDFLKLTAKGQNLAEHPDLMEILIAETAPLFKDRLMRQLLTEPDAPTLEKIMRMSEELGIELFSPEVE